MGAGHNHGHSHSHSHGVTDRGRSNQRRLAWVLVLVALYMVAEVVGGFLTGSLALLADAGHMLSDAGAIALSLFAIWIARRPATSQRTYGYYRTEILAALINGATLVGISIYIFFEAADRFREPHGVEGGLMMAIAIGGLLVNIAALMILEGGREDSLNVRGAWLHVLTDALGSVGAIVAGLLIWQFGWTWADPVASILIGILVIFSSWSLLKETIDVLMEHAPGHIDVDDVRDAIMELPGVESVHDLHVWTITSGLIAMSGHVGVDDAEFTHDKTREIQTMIHDRFGIDHTTIQLEAASCAECNMVV